MREGCDLMRMREQTRGQHLGIKSIMKLLAKQIVSYYLFLDVL